MIRISIANHSTAFSDADLPALANALQIHATRDLLPIWGKQVQVYYTPAGHYVPADHWGLYLLNNADQAGALGVHDVTPSFLPLGKVFVNTTLSDGGLVSVTASHEFDEIIGDPWVNMLAQKGSVLYAWELNDAVERDQDGFDVDVPANFAGGPAKVRLSNFVLPAWFEEGNTTGPYDFMGQLKAPFTLNAGGYANILDLNNQAAGWQQIFGDTTSIRARMAARPQPGSRRSRRRLARTEWQASVYTPSYSSPHMATQLSTLGIT